jgi:signal transduction histidine kinase
LVTLVAVIDWWVGWEISLFIFYAIPIAISSWHLGKEYGFFIALVSSGAWWLAQASGNPYETGFGLVLASLNRMFYFGVVVFATVGVRNRRIADAARIRALEDLRQLEKDLVAVSEHEQQRIGQDLHDGICQQLAAVGCAVSALAQDLKERGDPGASDAELIGRSIQQAVADARELAHGILPVHVDRQGLAVALSNLAATMTGLTGVQIKLHETTGFQFDDPGRAMHLYRIAQEAVANAVRHGRARRVDIYLSASPGWLEMRIEDDGRGMPEQQSTEGGHTGMGLRTMRYRAQSLGDADFAIFERLGGGTVIRCRLLNPLNPPATK